MRTPRSFAAVAVVGIAALGIGVAAPAFAAAPSVPAARNEALTALAKSAAAVQVRLALVNADKTLRVADQKVLRTALQASAASVAGLRAKVMKDTSVAAISSDMKAYSGLHIADFVLPRATLVQRADKARAMVAAATTQETVLYAAITTVQSVQDVSAELSAYSDYVTNLLSADLQTGAARDSELALTTDSAAKAEAYAATLSADTHQLAAADTKLKAAAADAVAITTALKNAPPKD